MNVDGAFYLPSFDETEIQPQCGLPSTIFSDALACRGAWQVGVYELNAFFS